MSNISGTPPQRAKKTYSQTEVEKSEINTQTESRAEAREAKKQKANTTHNRETQSVRVMFEPREADKNNNFKTKNHQNEDVQLQIEAIHEAIIATVDQSTNTETEEDAPIYRKNI